MAELKTQPNESDPRTFVEAVENDERRSDCLRLLDMMGEISGEEPFMWGDSIIGYGLYRYTYASGRSGEWFRIGFSPRKQNITVYLADGSPGYSDDAAVKEIFARLGKHKTGKACLYIKRLSDVDEAVLRELIRYSLRHSAMGEGG
ncbi:MAG: DUF1801 domain-containing protein [Spirochaetales bacterium]|nr:DUF1801 domain-containing protein [Spirochaetales bacterium]